MDAEQIVRTLAAAWAPLDGLDCQFCGAIVPYEQVRDPEAHKPDCPWRLAREWVDANPSGRPPAKA